MGSALVCLGHTGSTLVRLFTSEHRQSCKDVLLHFIFCFLFSLLLGSLLFLGLLFSLQYNLLVSGIISGCGVLLLTASLFISQRVRCFTLLFLISCSLEQGRNIFLATGLGLVFLWNVRNTFQNLHRVARSVMCNLKQEVDFPDPDFSPLRAYVDMIRQISEKMENVAEFGVVRFNVETTVSGSVGSEKTKEKLEEAAQMLNTTAETAQAIYNSVVFIGQRVTPGIGVVVLAVTTLIFFKVYRQNKSYLNCCITPEFVRYDKHQNANGKPHVLPLTKKEAKRYQTIPSGWPTVSDWKTTLKFFMPVVVHLFTWSALIGLDALLYWTIRTVNWHLTQLKPTDVPLKAFVNVSLISLLDVLSLYLQFHQLAFSYSIKIFRTECLPQPTLLISQSLVPLSVILVVLATMGLLAPKFLQAKVLLIERFYCDSLTERVQYLHAKIVRKRSKKKLRALKSTLKSYGTNVSALVHLSLTSDVIFFY
ncbi:hypothetical protein ACEWY4_023910 [Coilia grayii]|uniref:Dendritic cell-specific transmembrane protein-like domain-containing protein n=1 Tax=Coilia grayii TaxID=363190 RepID=A0ABD1IYV0_9TELE